MSAEAPEEWRAVVGYEGLYEVSDQGRVRSFHGGNPRTLKLTRKGRGYFGVNLYKNRVQNQLLVHRLVLEAFNPRADAGGLYALHSDGNLSNNQRMNLRWGTHEDNMRDMVLHGTAANQNTRKTHCLRGHRFSEENTYKNRKGARVCRECHRNYSRNYSAKMRRATQI